MRRIHKSTDSLPDAARQILLAGFGSRRRYSQIALDLAALGFKVSAGVIARRAYEWRREQARRETLVVLRQVATAQGSLVDEPETAVLDLGPFWRLRSRRAIQKCVSNYLDSPTVAAEREVMRRMVLYRLQVLSAQGNGDFDADVAH